MNLLETKNVEINFGGVKAVSGVDLVIKEKELVGLIGPNGAGKTTIFNLLTGVYKATQGDIIVSGVNINKLRTDQIVKLGLARTFQNIRLFKNLTVIENILLSFDRRSNYSNFDAIFRTKRYREEENKYKEKSLELLRLFDMEDIAYVKSNSLSYGQQRKLEIARALATYPKVLLLDEPAAGMNPQETMELMNIIKHIRDKFEIAILLIEHDMNLVMGICEKLYVLNFGKLIASGSAKEVQNNKEVIKAYLGE